jgi:enamine deaminase RidA (YjgF/YER057c/UK114 family)
MPVSWRTSVHASMGAILTEFEFTYRYSACGRAAVRPARSPQRSVDAYRQASIANGSKLVFIAGQVAWDADGVTVGEGDLAAQVEQCYLDIATALAAAGAAFDDVAKMTGVTPVPPASRPGVAARCTRASGRGRGRGCRPPVID